MSDYFDFFSNDIEREAIAREHARNGGYVTEDTIEAAISLIVIVGVTLLIWAVWR